MVNITFVKVNPFIRHLEAMSKTIQDFCSYLSVYDVMDCVNRHLSTVIKAALRL